MKNNLKIWLDDQIDDPDCPDRHPPKGWIGCKTAIEACRYLQSGRVQYISLDHDLGDHKFSGYIVAKFIEKNVYFGKIKCPIWSVHSANPVGRIKIEAALKKADRFELTKE